MRDGKELIIQAVGLHNCTTEFGGRKTTNRSEWRFLCYLRRFLSSLSFSITFFNALGRLALGTSLSFPLLAVGPDESSGLSAVLGLRLTTTFLVFSVVLSPAVNSFSEKPNHVAE